MTAMRCAGQWAVPAAISADAAWGEGGSCGHHHVRCANRVAMMRAMCWALVDWGEERKPCKYSTWVVVWADATGMGAEGMAHASSQRLWGCDRG